MVSGLLIITRTQKTFLLNIEDFGNTQIELFIYQFHHIFFLVDRRNGKAIINSAEHVFKFHLTYYNRKNRRKCYPKKYIEERIGK